MKRFHVRIFAIVSTLIVVPLIGVEAAFVGPSQSPPAGNVPGVIWNRSTAGGSANEQAATEMNISGSARLGGDAILADGKALRIDQVGTANLYIGNWGNGVQGLTVTINGDVNVVAADTSEGKVTAPKFCLGVDCITQWPAPLGGGITSVTAGTGLSGGGNVGDVSIEFDAAYGDGRYVNVSGDQMQGALQVPNPPMNPLDAVPKAYVDDVGSQKLDLAGGTLTGPLILSGSPADPMEAAPRQYVDALIQYVNGAYLRKDGVQDTAQGHIVFEQGLEVAGASQSEAGIIISGNGLSTGIQITATSRGILSTANDYAYVSGGNPQYGMYVGQSTNGAYFRGSSKGVWAKSPGQAGYFENELAGGNAYAVLGGATAPGEFYSPVGTTSLWSQRNAVISGILTVGGDLQAPSNALSSCAWTAYVADGVAIQCAAARPIMNGVQRSGASERIYCCAL